MKIPFLTEIKLISQMFDSVSILFSDVVTFTEICSRICPMDVVSMLNAMYSLFDTLTERNHVYKVSKNHLHHSRIKTKSENLPWSYKN